EGRGAEWERSAERSPRAGLEVSWCSTPLPGTSGGAVMHILATILFGLVVGIIAKLLMPGRDPGGFIVTILLGIAGSFVGTYLGRALWGGANYAAGWIA